MVSRPRLVKRLNRGEDVKLRLVSAPAGFGKTTLLAEWITTAKHPIAWVSLDTRDNDGTLFWAYFISGLQTILPNTGRDTLTLLYSPQPPATEFILTSLINEVSQVEDEVALILDDYHLIESPTIHAALVFLLEHLPPNLHLVIASRTAPKLPLAGLRAKGQLIELKASDLCFDAEEAAAFLQDKMGLALSPENVAALERRTEGWIAGLQLAALSMQGSADLTGFVDAFSGDDRHIIDYLAEEVLQKQPAEVRNFLLQTSILSRLHGKLCDAIVQGKDSAALLEHLERSNLFVVPLDDKRQWYRFHHLFAEVLHTQLQKELPDEVAALHERASAWYASENLVSDAIHHAFAAKDYAAAAALIERAWRGMDQTFQSAMWLSWVQQLPRDQVLISPVLCTGYAWAHLDVGNFDAGVVWLDQAEQWLARIEAGDTAGMVVADQGECNALPSTLALARAYVSQGKGAFQEAASHARRALDFLPEDNLFERGKVTAVLGISSWAWGDLETAYASLAAGIRNIRTAGQAAAATSGAFVLAELRLLQGRLQEAIQVAEEALQMASTQETVLPGIAELHIVLSETYCARGDLEKAGHHLIEAQKLGKQAALELFPYRYCIAQALIKEAQHDILGAIRLVQQAAQRFKPDPLPNVRPFAAFNARLWIKQKKFAEAQRWANEHAVSLDDHADYLQEYAHLTLVRLQIAQHKNTPEADHLRKTAGLLKRLFTAASTMHRTQSVIEILMLQAMVYGKLLNESTALNYLEQALALAEQETHCQPFLNERDNLQALLRKLVTSGAGGAFARTVLSAIEAPPSAAGQDLTAPLTKRELEILRLIVGGMRNQEIADHLFISLSTVKRHIANAYGKLDVSHRTEAIALANKLNLL